MARLTAQGEQFDIAQMFLKRCSKHTMVLNIIYRGHPRLRHYASHLQRRPQVTGQSAPRARTYLIRSRNLRILHQGIIIIFSQHNVTWQ